MAFQDKNNMLYKLAFQKHILFYQKLPVLSLLYGKLIVKKRYPRCMSNVSTAHIAPSISSDTCLVWSRIIRFTADYL